MLMIAGIAKRAISFPIFSSASGFFVVSTVCSIMVSFLSQARGKDNKLKEISLVFIACLT